MALLYLSCRFSQIVSGQEQGEREEGRVVDDVSDDKVVRVEVGADRFEDDVFPETQVVEAEHAGPAKEDEKQCVLHDVLFGQLLSPIELPPSPIVKTPMKN